MSAEAREVAAIATPVSCNLSLRRLRELHGIAVSMNSDGNQEFGPLDDIDVEFALAELIELRKLIQAASTCGVPS